MSLTTTQIKALKPKITSEGKVLPTKHYIENNLFIFANASGTKTFKIVFKIGGVSNTYTVGNFPEVSLEQAKLEALRIRNLVKKGINPNQLKKKEKEFQKRGLTENQFKRIAEDWFESKKKNMSETHKKRILGMLKNYVYPHIGSKDISRIVRDDIIAIAKIGDKKGYIETTRRTLGIITEIYKYAIILGLVENDPSYAVKEMLGKAKTKSRAAITEDPKRLGEILNLFDVYEGSPTVKALLQLGPMLFQRPGELRRARWSEINLEKAEWRYFVTKTSVQHIIPLSKQVVAILTDLKRYTGDSPFVFPGRYLTKEMSNNAVLSAYRSLDISKDELCEHGWRATARTMLDELLGYPIPHIEMQLAHEVRDTNGRAYNRTQYLADRKIMMQAWSDFLEAIRLPNADINAIIKDCHYNTRRAI